jgi:hypothetical protein
MQLGCPSRSSGLVRTLVCLASLAVAGACRADEYEAFCWEKSPIAPTEHVYPLVLVDPWTDITQAAARLNSFPAGKRFVVLQHITDDLADNPADRVISRTWETRTRQIAVPAPSKASPPVRAAPVLASQGRAAGSAPSRPQAAAPAAAVTMTTITERVPVDRLTEFRGPWLDNGIRTVGDRVRILMQRLKAAGAQVDGFVLSNETHILAATFLERPGSLEAIERDPRWPALARSLGMPTIVSDMSWGSNTYFLWTERMSGRFDAAMNQAVFNPIRAAYPKAVVSNYCSGRMNAANAGPDLNGHFDRRLTAGFGTHDNFEFYGWLGFWRIEKTKGGLPADPGWIAFRVEMHKIRGMNASSSRPKHAWIGSRSWTGETWGPVAIASHPLWDELILQLGMHGVRQFLELTGDEAGRTLEQSLAQRPMDRLALDALMAELNGRVSGAGSGILVANQPSWDDRVIATGRRLADRVVWRFSFAEGVDSVRIRLSDGSEMEIVPEPGRRGAWFEHSLAVSVQLDASGRMPAMEIAESSRDTNPAAPGMGGA